MYNIISIEKEKENFNFENNFMKKFCHIVIDRCYLYLQNSYIFSWQEILSRRGKQKLFVAILSFSLL